MYLEEILNGHEISDFARDFINSCNTSESQIRKTYHLLKRIGLSDEKIASQAQLLGMNPDTIERNYQNHIKLLRNNYRDKNSGKELLLDQAGLLGIPTTTIEKNVQFLYSLCIGNDQSVQYTMLLGSKPQTKREKMVWMLRELFDYDGKRKTIYQLREFVADNPSLLIKGIKTLEKKKDKLREKVQKLYC